MTIADSYKPKILVVEDSYLTAEAVCDMVVKYGCDVAGAVGRVDTGVQFLREHDIDGAVVDIDLHGTTSFPICEQLRKRDIPFIFLTGYDRDYAVPEEFRSTPWLYKPVDHREFERALAGLARSAVPEPPRANLLLDRLSAADWRALRPQLERVALQAGEVLGVSGSDTEFVYFPTSGMISVIARSPKGKAIEVGLVGRESMTGLEVVLGKSRSAGTESVVHSPGEAWRLPARQLEEVLESRPSLRRRLLAAVHAFLGQITDNAVAIGHGTIEQRLARRLVTASLRLGSSDLSMTHDALAKLLAVRRSGITVALHMLESKHLVRSRRSLVEILDHDGLMRAAGEDSSDHDGDSAAAPHASPEIV